MPGELASILFNLQACLASLERIEARLATVSDSRSSVVLETNTRGVTFAVKAYAGSEIGEADAAARAAFDGLRRDYGAQP